MRYAPTAPTSAERVPPGGGVGAVASREWSKAVTKDKNDTAIFLSVIADAPDALLIAELEKRGYTVTDGQIPFSWEDESDGEEALSA